VGDLLSKEEVTGAIDTVEWGERKHVERAKADLRRHIAALENERDAALADNAALVHLVRVAAGDRGPGATCWACGGRLDHGKACRFGAALERLHPGAALLEEHREALVRARNEGLEKVAQAMPDALGTHATVTLDDGGVVLLSDYVSGLIRAMKEPESDPHEKVTG
jgi:hypothetical protein